VIITDHHTPDETKPDAMAVLNPKVKESEYPFHHLCGAGVALKVVQALSIRQPGKIMIEDYLQIAAIGTVADMVPLREENRWIVVQGLKAMDADDQGPVRALVRRLGIRGKVTALDISYKVAPRINAPGRLGDPDTAIEFFESVSPRDACRAIEIMDGMNMIRQMRERDLEAKMELQPKHCLVDSTPPFVMVAGPHWHRGILGIMACKLLRRYGKPSCVLSFDDQSAHGSIRGLPGLDLLEFLHRIAPLMTSFGGHPEAAGVTLPITNIPQFKARMTELMEQRGISWTERPRNAHHIDAVVDWGDLDDRLFENLRKLAPFGIGNSLPVFLSPNLILESELARKGPWFHFEASDGNVARKCSFYHPSELNIVLERFDSIDLVYSLAPFRNEYQVQILEIRPSVNN
jgi:single-stranded-DNA-specific exonuclease